LSFGRDFPSKTSSVAVFILSPLYPHKTFTPTSFLFGIVNFSSGHMDLETVSMEAGLAADALMHSCRSLESLIQLYQREVHQLDEKAQQLALLEKEFSRSANSVKVNDIPSAAAKYAATQLTATLGSRLKEQQEEISKLEVASLRHKLRRLVGLKESAFGGAGKNKSAAEYRRPPPRSLLATVHDPRYRVDPTLVGEMIDEGALEYATKVTELLQLVRASRGSEHDGSEAGAKRKEAAECFATMLDHASEPEFVLQLQDMNSAKLKQHYSKWKQRHSTSSVKRRRLGVPQAQPAEEGVSSSAKGLCHTQRSLVEALSKGAGTPCQPLALAPSGKSVLCARYTYVDLEELAQVIELRSAFLQLQLQLMALETGDGLRERLSVVYSEGRSWPTLVRDTDPTSAE
jgi:hypothetical protein